MFLYSFGSEAIKRLNKQTARVTPEMNEDAKRLLALMGIPVIQVLLSSAVEFLF